MKRIRMQFAALALALLLSACASQSRPLRHLRKSRNPRPP